MSRYNNGTSSFLVILAVLFFPPLGVFLMLGCGHEVLVAIGLSILGWFPGVFYAMYLYLETGGSSNINAIRRIDLAKNRYRQSRAPAARPPLRRSAPASRPVPSTPTVSTVLANSHVNRTDPAVNNAPKPAPRPMKKTLRDQARPNTRAEGRAAPRQANPEAVVLTSTTVTQQSDQQQGTTTAAAWGQAEAASALTPAVNITESQGAAKQEKASGFLGGIFTSKKTPAPEGTASEAQATTAGATTVPSNRSAQSSPAPGTPGQSAVVNPQISTIKATKPAKVEAEGA